MITIGSSDVPVILGISPHADASEWATQAKLLGLIPRYTMTDNPAQARGRMLEAAILSRYALETGFALAPGPSIAEPPTLGPEPWMAVRVDAWMWQALSLYQGNFPPTAEVEAKSVRRVEPRPDNVAQVRYQLAVTDLPFADLVSFGMMDDGWKIERIERDLELEARILGKLRRWYRRHVLEGVPVDPDGSEATARAIARAYTGATGETAEATATDLEQVRRVRQLDEAIGELVARRDQERNRLRARLGTATRLKAPDGATLATYTERKGRVTVDLAELRKTDPKLAATVAKIGARSRALTIKKRRT